MANLEASAPQAPRSKALEWTLAVRPLGSIMYEHFFDAHTTTAKGWSDGGILERTYYISLVSGRFHSKCIVLLSFNHSWL